MMLFDRLLFDSKDKLEIISVVIDNKQVILSIKSYQTSSSCPCCHKSSKRVHSYYIRKLKDLPVIEHSVLLQLYTRKFYCYNNACRQRIFTERYREHIQASQRITQRLANKLLKTGMLMGGNGGSRICSLMNITTSSSTLIRLVKKAPLVNQQEPAVVGIDDWAYRKGHRYGTVVVDLKQQKMIDLLPDREAATISNWFKEHPGVKIVSRDRYVNYASGITTTLPDAIQVADRWHLIKNLGDAVKGILQRCQGQLKQKAQELYRQQLQEIKMQPAAPVKVSLSVSLKQELMDKVKILYKKGTGIRTIARMLDLSRNTVKKYLRNKVALPRCCPSRTKQFLFEDYIKHAVATRPNVLIKDLYEEIQRMGYPGKKTTGYRQISKYTTRKEQVIYPKDLPLQYWRPANVSILLYRSSDELRNKEVELINFLRKESPEIEITYGLFQKFRQMLTDKCDAQLTAWMEEATGSGIKELQSFVKGMLNDFSAVRNAFILPWSNGQVEGQVNKLKTVKRQMYGRASFHLLRKRLLYASG